MKYRVFSLALIAVLLVSGCSNFLKPQHTAVEEIVTNSDKVAQNMQLTKVKSNLSSIEQLETFTQFVDVRETTRLLMSNGAFEEIVHLAGVEESEKTDHDLVRKSVASMLKEAKQVKITSAIDGQIIRNEFNEVIVDVWIDGQLLNEMLIRNGMLDISDDISKYKNKDLLVKARQHAQDNNLGIWYVDTGISQEQTVAQGVTVIYYPNGMNIVIYNRKNRTEDFSGWLLRDVVSGSTLVIPKDTKVGPNEALTINTNMNPYAQNNKTLIWKNIINDTYVDLELYDANDQLVANYKHALDVPTATETAPPGEPIMQQ